MAARALELFGELRSETRPHDLVKQMSGRPAPGGRDRTHALSNAKLVMMDEPTAAISVRQVEQVLSLIHRLKEQGVAVMLISHRMPDVFAVCDRVVVMRRGEKRADKAIRDTSPRKSRPSSPARRRRRDGDPDGNPRSPSPTSARQMVAARSLRDQTGYVLLALLVLLVGDAFREARIFLRRQHAERGEELSFIAIATPASPSSSSPAASISRSAR
jgi:ABC-type sugar transport system ATPase subunit